MSFTIGIVLKFRAMFQVLQLVPQLASQHVSFHLRTGLRDLELGKHRFFGGNNM